MLEKLRKKIRKIENKIKKLKSEIRNLDKDDASNKNKLELKIENYKLEIRRNSIMKFLRAGKRKIKSFKFLHKAKNTRTKRYRKNVDEAYENLDLIATVYPMIILN